MQLEPLFTICPLKQTSGFYYLIFSMNFLPLVVMGSNMDYWQSFRIKISHQYIQRKSLYLEGPDKFNVNDNLFLLLKMSALKYWGISSL